MAMAAVARLCREGGWQRVLDGLPMTDALDIADADLLVSCGVFEQRSDRGGYSLARTDSWFASAPEALCNGATALLHRALRHARGSSAGWTAEDLELVLAQGRGSAAAGRAVVQVVVPQLEGAPDQLASGHARFLDVGVGVAGLAIEVCELLPGASALGIDVLAPVLDLGRREVTEHGLEGRIELERLDVAELDRSDEFDLAWLPQPFIPPEALRAGLDRVRAALVPGGWLVMPVSGPDSRKGVLGDALARHSGQLLGGGRLSVEEGLELVRQAGYAAVDVVAAGPLTVIVGRRD